MKKKKPEIRIPKGEMNCYGDSIASIIEILISKGFRVSDLDHITLELDDSACYYESDRSSICVEWPDMY